MEASPSSDGEAMSVVRTTLAVLILLLAAAPAARADHLYDDDPPAAEETYWPPEEGEEEEPVESEPVEEQPVAEEPIVAPVVETAPVAPVVEYVQTAQVPGTVARLRTDGRAAIPRGAPKRVRTLIAAMNRIVGKPYKWGGGHAKLIDRGYDCSGAVSYGLIGAGLLTSPQVSGTLARFGTAGAGRWISVYANKGHVYLEVAGLRLDTSAVGDTYGARSGVRWRSLIGKRRGFSTRHPVGL